MTISAVMMIRQNIFVIFFFFQAEDGIRDDLVTGVQTCALPIFERRISKLDLRLEGTALEPLIRQLYDELSAKGLAFHPPTHIGDEWFVPIGIPAIFVPFFLVHDRLRTLERTMMLEVEGETKEWF